MANRTAIVGLGAALLVIGLAGLGAEQTGVIFPGSSGRAPVVVATGPPGAGGALAERAKTGAKACA